MNYGKQELAEIWNRLNNWNWDERLGTKPVDWDEIPDYSIIPTVHTKRKMINPIMIDIENRIGYKECLRWHHVHN